MRFINLAGNVLAYWNCLRGKQLYNPEDHTLGALLNCPVLVINLERSRYRREFMLNYLAELGINAQLFQAVDGTTLNMDKLQIQGIYDDAVAHQKFSRSLSCAEIATTLSHLGIYRKIVEEKIPMVMVLEDDAMFSQGVANRISSALSELPTDWELLQLHHKCKEHIYVTEHLVRFPGKNNMPVGAAGYLIRNSGAKKLLAAGFPVCYPADSLIGRSPRWDVVLYGLALPVIVQNAIFQTEIQTRVSLLGKLKQLLKKIIVPTLSSIAKALTRLK